MESLAVHAPFAEAEAVRRELIAAKLLRNDLRVAKDDDGIWFPVTAGEATHDFEPQATRTRHYTELLDWPATKLAGAPRAFDTLGDVLLVKVPPILWDDRHELGDAMRAFVQARAVFHDNGVKGTYRVRDLERIAGEGGSETTVAENGVRLRVDPGAAYYSPRLADERGRITSLIASGERVIDLFGGVAPQGVQIAKVTDAEVVSVDLNPDAIRLASVNADTNKVKLDLHCGDARELTHTLEPADRVIMNLPHGAKDFLAEGAKLVRPGGTLHHHEIMAVADVENRQQAIIAELEEHGRLTEVLHRRHVRAYSSQDAHYVFDLRLL